MTERQVQEVECDHPAVIAVTWYMGDDSDGRWAFVFEAECLTCGETVPDGMGASHAV